MKAVKKVGKKVIIYIVIFMILLSNISCSAYTSEEVGNAIAGFAANVAIQYESHVEYSQGKRTSNPIWSPDSYSWNSDKYWFDCSSFASGCYHYVTGKFDSAQCTSSLGGFNSGDWEQGRVNSISDLQVGDLYYWNSGSEGHALIYIGNTGLEGATGDSCEVGGANGNIGFRNTANYLGNHTFYYVRLSSSGISSITNLNTEFSLTGSANSTGGTAINYSNFFFNGIPDGKYSLASKKGLLSTIIDFLANIIDYLIGILTYIIRIVFVGWTAIFDNLLNWTFQSVVSTNTEPAEAGISPTEANKTETSDRKVTIEKLIFNKFDLLDINIFE